MVQKSDRSLDFFLLHLQKLAIISFSLKVIDISYGFLEHGTPDFFFERRPTFTRALIWDSQIDSERVERKRTPQYHKKRNFFFILLLINWFTSNREREVGAKKTDQTRQSGRTFDRTFLAHRFPLLLKIGASKEPYSTKLKIREIN